jgi:hypothetical protein
VQCLDRSGDTGMEITGLGWYGARTGRCSELAHFYEHVLGLRLVYTDAEFWVFELADGRLATVFGSSYPGKEHSAVGPVVGFAVRFRPPLGVTREREALCPVGPGPSSG